MGRFGNGNGKGTGTRVRPEPVYSRLFFSEVENRVAGQQEGGLETVLMGKVHGDASVTELAVDYKPLRVACVVTSATAQQ